MIPGAVVVLSAEMGIPRESGDDPFVGLAGLAGQLYSPRERG